MVYILFTYGKFHLRGNIGDECFAFHSTLLLVIQSIFHCKRTNVHGVWERHRINSTRIWLCFSLATGIAVLLFSSPLKDFISILLKNVLKSFMLYCTYLFAFLRFTLCGSRSLFCSRYLIPNSSILFPA